MEGYVLKDVDGRYPGDGDGVDEGVEMKSVHGSEQVLSPDKRPGRQVYTALDVDAITKFVGESVIVRPPPYAAPPTSPDHPQPRVLTQIGARG